MADCQCGYEQLRGKYHTAGHHLLGRHLPLTKLDLPAGTWRPVAVNGSNGPSLFACCSRKPILLPACEQSRRGAGGIRTEAIVNLTRFFELIDVDPLVLRMSLLN